MRTSTRTRHYAIRLIALIVIVYSILWKAYAAVPDKDIESLFLAHPPHILFIGTGVRLPSFNPVRQYMDWKNVSDNQLSMGIIDYVHRKIEGGELDQAERALSLLSYCSDTNTMPFLFQSLSDKPYEPISETIMYVIGQRTTTDEIESLNTLLSSAAIEEKGRKRLYDGLVTRMAREVASPQPYKSFSKECWYVLLFNSLHSELNLSLRLQIDNGLDRYLKGWRISEERLELLRSWQNEPLVPDESLRLLGLRIAALHEARKTGNDRVACEWKPRKISSGDLDKMKQKAEALRNAPPPPPYEGPLVVDMEDAAE